MARSRDRDDDNRRSNRRPPASDRDRLTSPSRRNQSVSSARRRATDSYKPGSSSYQRDARRTSPSRGRSPAGGSQRSNRDRTRSRSPERDGDRRDRDRSPASRGKGGKKSDKNASDGPNVSANGAMGVATRWCFRCHSIEHWSADCTPTSRQKAFRCSTFHLDEFKATAREFEPRKNVEVTSTEELINHIYYAAYRLNFYGAYESNRDTLFTSVFKDSKNDSHIDQDQKELARISGVPPYEAYVAKSCRLTLTLVKAAANALRYLYSHGILPVVPHESPFANSNDGAQPFEEKCQEAAVSLRLHFQAMKDAQQAGHDVAPLDFVFNNEYLSRYTKIITDAFEKYNKSMDALRDDWKSLDASFELWRTKPDDTRTAIHGRLPFDTLRVGSEPAGFAIIPTLAFPKVELMSVYFPPKAKTEDVDMTDKTGASANSQSASGDNRELAKLRRDGSAYRAEILFLKGENEKLKDQLKQLKNANPAMQGSRSFQLPVDVPASAGSSDKYKASWVSIRPKIKAIPSHLLLEMLQEARPGMFPSGDSGLSVAGSLPTGVPASSNVSTDNSQPSQTKHRFGVTTSRKIMPNPNPEVAPLPGTQMYQMGTAKYVDAYADGLEAMSIALPEDKPSDQLDKKEEDLIDYSDDEMK